MAQDSETDLTRMTAAAAVLGIDPRRSVALLPDAALIWKVAMLLDGGTEPWVMEPKTAGRRLLAFRAIERQVAGLMMDQIIETRAVTSDGCHAKLTLIDRLEGPGDFLEPVGSALRRRWVDQLMDSLAQDEWICRSG